MSDSRPMTEVWYSVESDDHDERLRAVVRGQFDVLDNVSRHALAEIVADAWFHKGGYEVSWPVEFVLYADETSAALGRYAVDMEPVPEFTAREIRSAEGGAS